MLRAVGVGLPRIVLMCFAGLMAVVFTTALMVDTAEARKRHGASAQTASAKKAVSSKKMASNRKTRLAHKANRNRVADRSDEESGASASDSPLFASIVVDVNTGRVLNESNPDSLRHPASVTKVMTLYLLFEQVTARRMTLDTELPVSAYAAAQAPSKLGLRPGETIRVEDAIKALITRSANDAAVVVAEAIGGSESRFAQMMTRKARQLGMTRTVYVNASGLPDPRQITTARDLAKLGVAIQDRFPSYYRYFSTRSFVYEGRSIANHNKLLGRVDGVDGIKTGYTRASGFNLLTSVKRDGRQIVAVVLGGRTGAARDATMRRLIGDNLGRAYAGARQTQMVAEAALPAQDTMQVAALPTPKPSQPEPQAEPDPITVATAEPAVEPQPEPKSRPRPAVVAEAPKPLVAGPAAEPVRLASADVTMPAPRPLQIGKPAVAADMSSGPILRWVAGAAPLTEPASTGTRTSETTTTAPAATASVPVKTITFKVDTTTEAISEEPPTRPEPANEAVAPTPPAVVAEATPAPAPERSGWIIQIGATDSEVAAQKLLEKAKSSRHPTLASAKPFTETVNKNGSTLWRARFAGFDGQKQAQAACAALKTKSFACMPVRL